ncbi:MAG: nitroreductase family protein [Clostridia bacterium]|nr:nitroreductase family protein [Clostridia bacterium]
MIRQSLQARHGLPISPTAHYFIRTRKDVLMVIIDKEKCIGCGLCVSDCVGDNIIIEDGKACLKDSCIQCGHCVAICPMNAVSIPDYDMDEVEDFDKNRFGFDIDNLLHTIKQRRSIRQFEDRKVEREKLEKLVQAGRYTATGSNSQNCRFVIVQDGMDEYKKMIWKGIDYAIETPGVLPEDRRLSFKKVADRRAKGIDFMFRNAPAVVYVASPSPVNAALAAQNIELAAVSMGLGVMYNGYVVGATNMNPEALKWLDMEDKPAAVCMLLGYPSVEYKRSAPRKEADVRWR